MLKIYTHTTQSSYETAISSLKEKLAEKKFGVLSSIDLPEKFKEKELEFDGKFTILEICNPFEAFRAVNLNPKVVFFLPCKIVVSKKNDVGIIEMLKPTSMISELNDPELDTFALSIETTLIDVIESIR